MTNLITIQGAEQFGLALNDILGFVAELSTVWPWVPNVVA